MVPKTETYKGHELLVLNPNEKFPFKFGAKKAQMILDNLDHIREFASENGVVENES